MEERPKDSFTPVQPDEQLFAHYTEFRNDIRATDDTSLKLLKIAAPGSLISSVALTIVEKSGLWESQTEPAVLGVLILGISVLGVLFTIGTFVWQLRIIRKCNWLISRAANIEQQLFRHKEDQMHYSGMAKPDHLAAKSIVDIKNSSLIDFPWGKTQAVKLIYSVAIMIWFVPMYFALATITSNT